MEWEAGFSVGVVIACFAILTTNRVAPDIVMMGGLTLLLVSGILTPQEALIGMSNEGMITVGVLYVVVSGLKETGSIAWMSERMLGKPRSETYAQFRLMLPVFGLSAFLNNTPIVAIFIPAIQDWAKQHHLTISKLMIPLSYASIAGGICTLIGTSTNLVVNGLVIAETDLEGFDMFAPAWVGIPLAMIIISFTLIAGRWLLPKRQSALSQFANVREYTVEMVVEPYSPLVGKRVEEAGLRQLPGLFLIEIERYGQLISPVSSQDVLAANDQLIFVGIAESIVDLQKMRGLKPATKQIFKLNAPRHKRCLMEAVISNSCPIVGTSIRASRFRSRYNVAVIAVSRNGSRIRRKIGDIHLQAGDTLLLEGDPGFVEHYRNSQDFFLVSFLEHSPIPRHERSVMALSIMFGMIITVALGLLSMLQSAMLAAGLMLLTRCTTGNQARSAIDWKVLVVIAASFGIGAALQKTGAATFIATSLISLAGGSPWLTLLLVALLTSFFTEIVTNNAAAIIMFHIALASASALAVSFLPFAIVLMLTASSSFATPIGYQTNLMVYGPGGYRFSDYLRIGIPLNIIVVLTASGLTPFVWGF